MIKKNKYGRESYKANAPRLPKGRSSSIVREK
jgi:hypothetical protein